MTHGAASGGRRRAMGRSTRPREIHRNRARHGAGGALRGVDPDPCRELINERALFDSKPNTTAGDAVLLRRTMWADLRGVLPPGSSTYGKYVVVDLRSAPPRTSTHLVRLATNRISRSSARPPLGARPSSSRGSARSTAATRLGRRTSLLVERPRPHALHVVAAVSPICLQLVRRHAVEADDLAVLREVRRAAPSRGR